MNNSGINGRLADKKGRIAGLIAAKKTDVEIAENLYMSSVSRFPTSAESKQAVAALLLQRINNKRPRIYSGH